MGADLTWLSQEAKNIHHTIEGFFYVLIITLLLIGVITEYSKMAIGGIPSFPVLLGRVIVAVFLLQAYPHISNTIGDLSDAFAKQVGDLNQFDVIRQKLGDKFSGMSLSWLSAKESITIILSYIAFVLFHFSYYLAEGFLLYAWTLLYIFSPILIALFCLPATASATSGLFRSLIELSLWKPVWAVSATLLWSLCLSEVNKPQMEVNFLSVMSLVFILAASLVMTPLIVHLLAGRGLSTVTSTLWRFGMGSLSFSPTQLGHRIANFGGGVTQGSKHVYNAGVGSASRFSEKYMPKIHQRIKRLPKFRVPKTPPLLVPPGKKGNKK